jgi:hypothetical protein
VWIAISLACFVIAWTLIALFPLAFPNLGRNKGVAAGQERIPDGESAAIATIVGGIAGIQKAEHKPGTTALRDAHAKAHGCVKARFKVAGDLPPELAVGLFAEPRSYDAWIRFSNSDRHPQPDLKKDGRGMAVKLLGVPGDKLLDDERDATTHDFVMINHPVFFVRDAADYIDFVDGQKRGSDTYFFFGLRPPWKWRLHELLNGTRITGHPVRSPFEERYFSMVPYALGDRAVKFSARPCADASTPVPASGDDALRTMMVDKLAREPVCFDFQVQLQGDPHDMPVEDPTIEWSEAASPFRTVARIEIPAQDFTGNDELCQNLSFTPWHALPAHRPLGGINRVRKAAYTAISRWRHDENHVERKEP